MGIFGKAAVPPLMTRDEVVKARDEALARYRSDRHHPYRPHSVAEERQAWLEGRTLERRSVQGPEYRDAETPAEFFDDLLIQHGQFLARGLAETPVLVAVALAAREGAAAAREAARAALNLAPRDQESAWGWLKAWKVHPRAVETGGRAVVDAVLGDWKRLGLAEEGDTARAEKSRKGKPRERPAYIETEPEAIRG